MQSNDQSRVQLHRNKLDHLRSCTCCLHKTMVRTLASPPGLVDMGKVLATAQQIATEVEYNDCREHWSTSPKKNKPNKRKPVELQVFVHKKPAFGTLFQSCSLSLGFFGFPVVLVGNPHRRFPFSHANLPNAEVQTTSTASELSWNYEAVKA